MKTTEIAELQKEYLIPTYAPGLALVKGRGTHVWDAEGVAEHTGLPGAKCFFCNSGAEANEGLIE